MKKTRIILIALVIGILTAFSVNAKVDITAAGDFLKALGITDERTEVKSEISRGDYIELIARALKLDAKPVNESPFDDVPAEHACAPYAALLKNMNIVNGSGNRLMPDSAITLEEASYIAVRAMGYGYVIAQAQGSSINYSTVISSLNIARDINKKFTDTITGTEAEIIIYKMVLGDLMMGESFENDSVNYKVNKNKTILSEYWKLEEIEGIVTANEYTHLYNKEIFINDGYITINNVRFTDIAGYGKKLLGKRTVAYINKEDEIVFAYGYKNEELIINCENVKYDNGKIVYFEDEKEKNAYLEKSFTIIKNGRVTDFLPDLVKEADSIKLVDNNNDGNYDVVFIETYSYGLYAGTNTFEELIYDTNSANLIYSYKKESNKHIFVYKQNDEGLYAPCEPDELENGNALRCVVSDDLLFIEIYATGTVIDGKYTSKDEDYIYIDDKAYKLSDYAKNYYENISLGTEYTYMLADNGVVVAVLKGNGGLEYGFLIKEATMDSIEATIGVKILTSTGQIKTFTLAEKIYLDAVYLKSVSDTVKTALINSDGSNKYRLIRYGMNKEGLINAIDTTDYNYTPAPYEDPEEAKDALYCNYNYNASGNQKLIYKTDNNYFYYASNIECRINQATVIFRVPDFNTENEIDDTDFSCGGSFANDTAYMVDVYDVGETGIAGCIIYYSIAGDTFNNSVQNYKDYPFGVVDYVVNTIDDEGIATKKIYFWSNGKFKSAILDSEAYNHSNAVGENDGNTLSCGDIFTYNLDNSGYIDMYRIYFDFSEKKEIYNISDSVVMVNMGKIATRKGSDTMFIRDSNPASRYPVSLSANCVVVNKNGHVVPASITDIMTIKNVGIDIASKMFIWAKYTKASFQLIYID